MYPFRMYGRIIQLLRYKVTYDDALPGEDGELVYEERIDYCVTLEEANEVAERNSGATVEALNTGAYEWLDGVQVPDVPDTFTEAVKIYEMGQEAYLLKSASDFAERNVQLRADIDFIAVMQGVNLT